MGERREAARHAACSRRPPRNAGLDPDSCAASRQIAVPQYAGGRHRQSCRCGRAGRMGGDPRRAGGCRRHEMVRVEGPARTQKLHRASAEVGRLERDPGVQRPVNAKANVDAASAAATKTHSATYFVPYHKHAPIAPTVSLADVKSDGSVTLTHTARIRSTCGWPSPRCSASRRPTSSSALIPGQGISAVPMAAMPGPKTRPSCCRVNWANRCACSGCAPTTCNGRPSLHA